MKDFNVICAVSLNGVIGESSTNTIPWYIPSDLKYFKSVTMNKTVVMGSRTYHSIGKPLKDRRNIVITRNQDGEAETFRAAGVDESYRTFSEVLRTERAGFFVIGGQHIYGEAIRAVPSRMYITIVKMKAEGDVRFPIEGNSFLQDFIITSQNIRYVCEKRTGWMKENDIEYQYTEFARRDPGSY